MTGLISGRVTCNGAGVVGALVSTDTGGCALTLSGGHYLMVAPAGVCTVAADKSGYKPAMKNGVVVNLGDSVEVDLELKAA